MSSIRPLRDVEIRALERALLPGGEDQVHLSVGAGIVFKNFQVDLAIDLSDLVDTAAPSRIYQC